MRVITQNIAQRAADPNGIHVSSTDVGAPFADLALDGVLSSTLPWNGVSVVDLSDGLAVLVGFTTGATGSVADATITGRDQFGNPLVEVVTMPGAASAVSSVEAFSYIESIEMDGAYTNLEVGILAADDQFSPWTPWDTHRSDATYTVSIEVVSGTLAAGQLQHTVQDDLLINGPEPDSFFAEASPFATIAASVQGIISGPFTASRVKIGGASSAAVLKIKYLQAGNGNN